MNRKKIIAGNWKMNKTPAQAKDVVNEMIPLVKDASCEVVLCVPFVDLDQVLKAVKGTSIKVGAQNCHWEKNGAFTGEVSAEMLAEIGVDYVIVGHSERRTYFGETDLTVNNRVRAALNAGLNVIVCVGEHLEDREQGITFELIGIQTKVALSKITKEEMSRITIAYEPVWAIGTGKTATAEQADEVCEHIRNVTRELYDASVANNIKIQYGGSVNAKNAEEIFSKPNIDGGLIGGASLKPDDFSAITRAASK